MKQMMSVLALWIPLTFCASGCDQKGKPEPPPSRSLEEMSKSPMPNTAPGTAAPPASTTPKK